MTTLVFPAPSAALLPIADQPGLAVPVRRIYCLGRNYTAHVLELGGDPQIEQPFFFSKPFDAVVPSGATIPYPPLTNQLHHEIELVVVIGKAGANVPAEQALDHVYGYAVGIDLTRRDLQRAAMQRNRPWDIAKGFDRSAPIGAVRPAREIGHISAGAIWLEVNGERRQSADLSEMIWKVPEILAALSLQFELAPGDLVFTGTPQGVGPLLPGDRIVGGIDRVGTVELKLERCRES